MPTSSDPVPVLFLAGIGRSGTTLLERTLAETRGVTALGEVMHLWERGLLRNELCGCSVPFRQCPFWSAVGKRAFGGWDNVDAERVLLLQREVDRTSRIPLNRLRRPSSFARHLDEYVDHYARLYAGAREVSGGLLVDSSKQVSLAWALTTSTDVRLAVAHVVRDSRGVAYSWSKQTARPEAVDSAHATMPKYSASAIAALWTAHNLAAEPLRRHVPSARVRYEDFLTDAGATVTEVLALLGHPADLDHVTGSTVRLGPIHSCSGNPMRFTTGDVTLVPDEAWRREMPARARRTVTTLTSPLLLRYGYPL